MEDDRLNVRSSEEPLLTEKVLGGKSCPGCSTECLRKAGVRPPKLAVLGVGLLSLLNALPLTSLYPFLYFMIHDFHIAKSNDDLGYYVGAVGSSFMVGRFLTAAYWGVISDRYGRKPILYIGVVSIILFSSLFGLSTNFWMALISRFFLGVFNGMVGSLQAYASEICGGEYHAFVLSVISTMWGLGLIIGPALGGYLAEPAIKYPKLFNSSFFEQFPYALPCLCISLCAVPVLWVTFQMPETVHNHDQNMNEDSKRTSKDGVLDLDDVSSDKSAPPPSEHKIFIHEKTCTPHKSIYENWGLIASIAIYCIWSMQDIAYIEIFSLWAVSPRKSGGLSLTSSGVGQVLAISG